MRSQKLVEQQNAYNPIDNLHVNGAFTLGENIGDLGGLTIAYRAYQLSLKGKPAPGIQGFTGPQQFFSAGRRLGAESMTKNCGSGS
jgi:predicted metalloendopeptidase